MNMIHLQLVSMLAVLSTVGTTPVLFFEQGGYSGLHRWGVSPAAAPIHPIPSVRTPSAGDLGMQQAGDLMMGGEPHWAVGSRRWGANPSRASRLRQYRFCIHVAEVWGCRLEAQRRSFTQVRWSHRLKGA
jgi:hypothetical protein